MNWVLEELGSVICEEYVASKMYGEDAEDAFPEVTREGPLTDSIPVLKLSLFVTYRVIDGVFVFFCIFFDSKK